jgi:hypothetical protein
MDNSEKFLVRSIASLYILGKRNLEIKSLSQLNEEINQLPDGHVAKIQYNCFKSFGDSTNISSYNNILASLTLFKQFTLNRGEHKLFKKSFSFKIYRILAGNFAAFNI